MNGSFRMARVVQRRPGVIALVWLVHSASGVLVSAPIASVVEARLRAVPRADEEFFQDGGAWLFEIVRLHGPELGATAELALALGLLAALANLVSTTVLLVALQRDGRLVAGDVAATTTVLLPSMVALAGLGLLVRSALVAALVLILAALGSPLELWFGERGGDLVQISLMLAGLGGWLLLGVMEDLARAAVAHRGSSALTALGQGLRAFRRRPGPLLLDFAAASLWGLVLVGLGAFATELWDVSKPGSWRVALTLATHQAVLLGLVVLRAWWLSRSLVAAGADDDASRVPQSPDDRPGRRDAPDGPRTDPDASPAA